MLSGNEVVLHLIDEFGSDAQRLKYRSGRTDVRMVGSVALIGPGPGINTGDIKIKARFRQEDFSWVLNGKSSYAIDADEASVVVVFANVDWDAAAEHKKAAPTKGILRRLVDSAHIPLRRREVGSTAFIVGITPETGLRMHESRGRILIATPEAQEADSPRFSQLTLEDVLVGSSAILLSVGSGARVAAEANRVLYQ